VARGTIPVRINRPFSISGLSKVSPHPGDVAGYGAKQLLGGIDPERIMGSRRVVPQLTRPFMIPMGVAMAKSPALECMG